MVKYLQNLIPISVRRFFNLPAHLRYLGTRPFVYKYFPQVFLWSRFGPQSYVNQQAYWDGVYQNEQGQRSIRFGAMIYKVLRKKIEFRGKSILDVGCGRGDFLLSIEEDCFKFGVDFSAVGLQCLKGRGIRVKRVALPQLGYKQHFDVITCFETLEHVLPWRESLDQMIGHLKDAGYLILSVPYEKKIVIQEHVVYFDLERLHRFLKKRLSVLEIDILGPWLLVIAQKIAYQPQARQKIFKYHLAKF